MENLNAVLSTRENIRIHIDDIEALSKELIIQTLNSSKTRTNENTSILYDLSKLLIDKQNELTNLLKIANEQQRLLVKINHVKAALVESDSDIKNLLLYLKEAEQVLSSAVYQSRLKIDIINQAKPIGSELIIQYAHKISSEYGVCCPEGNWVADKSRRPYPTDFDMRKGWLGKINMMNDYNTLNSSTLVQQKSLIRSNSKIIDPIVPQEFSFNKNGNNMTEFMSDLSSDSSNDSDNS